MSDKKLMSPEDILRNHLTSEQLEWLDSDKRNLNFIVDAMNEHAKYLFENVVPEKVSLTGIDILDSAIQYRNQLIDQINQKLKEVL